MKLWGPVLITILVCVMFVACSGLNQLSSDSSMQMTPPVTQSMPYDEPTDTPEDQLTPSPDSTSTPTPSAHFYGNDGSTYSPSPPSPAPSMTPSSDPTCNSSCTPY